MLVQGNIYWTTTTTDTDRTRVVPPWLGVPRGQEKPGLSSLLKHSLSILETQQLFYEWFILSTIHLFIELYFFISNVKQTVCYLFNLIMMGL